MAEEESNRTSADRVFFSISLITLVLVHHVELLDMQSAQTHVTHDKGFTPRSCDGPQSSTMEGWKEPYSNKEFIYLFFYE